MVMVVTMAMTTYGYSLSCSCGCSREGRQFLLIACFVLNLARTVPALLSNTNTVAAKDVAVVLASLTMAVVAYVYVTCAVPVSVIGVSLFVAKAVCAGQPCLTASRASRDRRHEGTPRVDIISIT